MLRGRRIRLDVRYVGKAATFALMFAVPAIAWSNLGLPGASTFSALGWPLLVVGLAEYAIATLAYALDLRAAVAV